MEAKRRRRTVSDAEIIAKFPSFKMKECSVKLSQMDFPSLNKKPLSNEDIDRILQESSDSNASDVILSPTTKSRLRKKENGMVFIPRSKYNEHPAKDILTRRKSRRNTSKAIIKVKLSPSWSKKPKSPVTSRLTRNNNSIYTKNAKKKPPTRNTKSHDIEYHLEFLPPKPTNRRLRRSRSIKPLSDFMMVDSLPSKLWEIERIPPLIPKVEEDSITKELMALTEENKENVQTSGESTSDGGKGKEVGEGTGTSAGDGQQPQSKHAEETMLKDELEALLSDAGATVQSNEDFTIKDDVLPKVPSHSDITSEDIEKTIKDVVGDACQMPMDLMEDDSKETEKDSTETVNEETKPQENQENDTMDVKDEDVEKKDVAATQEEKPSDEPKKCVRFQETEGEKRRKDVIKSLIFRKYSETQKTYEKVVVFTASMDYTVTINNRQVELIGAPHEMTSTEDLQILLQIVDELNLDSFIVDCKS